MHHPSLLCFQVARGENGATTVSATMFFAAMVFFSNTTSILASVIISRHFCLTACTFENFVQVNIPIFVTGGIGGVHRHGEHSMLTSYILLIH